MRYLPFRMPDCGGPVCPMGLLEQPITIDRLREMAHGRFGDLVKAVVGTWVA